MIYSTQDANGGQDILYQSIPFDLIWTRAQGKVLRSHCSCLKPWKAILADGKTERRYPSGVADHLLTAALASWCYRPSLGHSKINLWDRKVTPEIQSANVHSRCMHRRSVGNKNMLCIDRLFRWDVDNDRSSDWTDAGFSVERCCSSLLIFHYSRKKPHSGITDRVSAL